MELGYFTMPSHPPERDLKEGHEWDLEVIRWLDELGYKECWIGEHHTAPWEPHPSPDLLVAQALMQTKNIRLGPGGFLLPFTLCIGATFPFAVRIFARRAEDAAVVAELRTVAHDPRAALQGGDPRPRGPRARRRLHAPSPRRSADRRVHRHRARRPGSPTTRP